MELKKLLSSQVNNPAPTLVPALLELFKETFFFSESEIADLILKIHEAKTGDARKLGMFGYLNGVAVDVPESFLSGLKTASLTDSFENLHCSLKLENVHLLSDKIRAFIATFYNEFQIPISLNMYITPSPEAPCFKPHCDATEVFIIQLLGEKKWSFFTNQEHHYLAGLDDKSILSEEALRKTIRKEITVKEEDVLHIPPMLYHEACAVGGPSIHLTVSLNRLRMDHLVRVMEAALLEEMKVLKYKNLSNEEFEELFANVLAKMSSESFQALLKAKKEQMMFLSGTQLLIRGR